MTCKHEELKISDSFRAGSVIIDEMPYKGTEKREHAIVRADYAITDVEKILLLQCFGERGGQRMVI